ncbi:hypothetical protein N386_gp74 [Puniceispirillum phage HMO-2011]|uniref:hypothetical protein n=1 Tax=Puniceispirillum phage HMO-2011 TaxID=948071 RepID=UPI0003518D4D|nr:hypothetical protein N386_gp74 [Puniceispirillum phage HMO-2011]ADW08446.1 hypothetical protein phage1322_74 [Puniceispirillum phage HMO-2011]
MTNSKTTFAVQLAEANNTVQAKGLVLSQWDKSITKGDKSRFKALCARDGFWFSLGEVCLELLKQSGGNRTDSALLKDANLHTVAKQRRKEAMDFVLNFKVIEDNKLLGKFASMKELLKAVDKIVNPKVEQSDEPKVETPVEPKATAQEPKADTIQSVKTADDLALDVLLQVELNGISIADFKIAMANAIGMIENNNEVIPFDVAV